MILTRAPLRITLGGGGTDIQAYYEKFCGLCIAAAIDKYVYIALHKRPDARLVVKYMKMEDVGHVDELQHPIVREALKLHHLDGRGMEIVAFADIPAGTGLGSSGSFTVALLKALHAYTRTSASAQSIAANACRIEIDLLQEPIGKQDQFIAAYGGVMEMHFLKDGGPLMAHAVTTEELEDSLLMFFTGYTHSASAVLAPSTAALKAGDEEVIHGLHLAKAKAEVALDAIRRGDMAKLGALFSEGHEAKSARGLSTEPIDAAYAYGMGAGALGGKLVGAGGGGFLLFVAADKAKLRQAMKECGLVETRFRVDYEGVKLLNV